MKYFELFFFALQCTILIWQKDFNIYRGYDTLRFNIVRDLIVPVDDEFPIYVHKPSACDFRPRIITKFTQEWKEAFFERCNVKMNSFPSKYDIILNKQWVDRNIRDIISIPGDATFWDGLGILYDENTHAKINIYLLICETERIIIIIPTGGENEEARERYKGHDYATGAGFFL